MRLGKRSRGDRPHVARVAAAVRCSLHALSALDARPMPAFQIGAQRLTVFAYDRRTRSSRDALPIWALDGLRTVRAVWPRRAFLDRRSVVEIACALGEQPDVLVALRRAISDALRHRVRLRPDDARADPPAVVLKRDGQALRHQHQVLRLEAGAPFRAAYFGLSVQRRDMLAACAATQLVVVRVGVTVVEPQRSIGAQHPPHPAEHLDQLREMVRPCRFEPDLPIGAVVTQAPIRRARHHAVHALVGKLAQPGHHVGVDDANRHAAPRPAKRCTSSGLVSLLRHPGGIQITEVEVPQLPKPVCPGSSGRRRQTNHA